MSQQTEIHPDGLLQHAGFVRALARALLLDPDRADDVVQETLMAAVRRPPRDRTRLRAWLGAVGRRIALKRRRSDGRRPRREKEAARKEALPSTAEVAAQLELQRQVVDAVRELAEPYRSTVMHRYFHDRTPTEIAQALEVPKKTVEARLTRALKQLRGRLDRTHGRRAWSAVLLAIAVPQAKAVAATTAFALSAKATTVALLVGAGLTVSAVVALDRTGRSLSRRVTNEPLVVTDPPAEPTLPDPQGRQRVEAETARPQTAPLKGPCTLRGAIRLQGGATVAGVKVWMRGYTSPPNPKLIRRDTVTDADGGYELAELPAGAYQIHAEHEGYAPFVSGHHFLVTEQSPERGGLIWTLTRGATLRVRLTDGARRITDCPVTLLTEPRREQRTDDQGVAAWPHLARGRYTVTFRYGGAEYRRTTSIWKDKDGLIEFVVGKVVHGTVTVHGVPRPNVKVRFLSFTAGDVETTTDARGRYEFVGLDAGTYHVVFFGAGLAAADMFAHVGSAMSFEQSFALGGPSISGRVLGANSGASVTLRSGARLIAQTDDEGRFAFFNLRPGEYSLSVSAHGSGVRAGPQKVTLRAGRRIDDVTFRLVPIRRGNVELTILGPEGDLVEKSVQFYVGLDDGASISMLAEQKTPGRHTLRLVTGKRIIRMQVGALSGEIEVEVLPDETIARTVRLR